MDSDRIFTIDVVGGSPKCLHYVWMKERDELPNAMIWCVNNVKMHSWQLLFERSDDGFENVGVGFYLRDDAFIFMMTYSGRYEYNET